MDVDKIIAGLSEERRAAIKGWKWKGWVAIRSDNHCLLPTGLVDVARIPMRKDGTRKIRLNETGLAVRARLMGEG